MSQEHNESFNSIELGEQRDNNERRNGDISRSIGRAAGNYDDEGAESGSSSDSDTDSESSSTISNSSPRRNSFGSKDYSHSDNKATTLPPDNHRENNSPPRDLADGGDIYHDEHDRTGASPGGSSSSVSSPASSASSTSSSNAKASSSIHPKGRLIENHKGNNYQKEYNNDCDKSDSSSDQDDDDNDGSDNEEQNYVNDERDHYGNYRNDNDGQSAHKRSRKDDFQGAYNTMEQQYRSTDTDTEMGNGNHRMDGGTRSVHAQNNMANLMMAADSSEKYRNDRGNNRAEAAGTDDNDDDEGEEEEEGEGPEDEEDNDEDENVEGGEQENADNVSGLNMKSSRPPSRSSVSSSSSSSSNSSSNSTSSSSSSSSSSGSSDEASENDDNEEDDEEDVEEVDNDDDDDDDNDNDDDDDDDDDYPPKRTARPNTRRPPAADKAKRTTQKKKKHQNWMSDESAEEGSDGSESIPSKRKFVGKYGRQSNNMQKKKKLCMSSDGSGEENKRPGTRRSAVAISYKEASEDEKTDSEDLLEIDYDETPTKNKALDTNTTNNEDEEKCETIERILAKRIGRKGCTGNQTTIYAIEESGFDPNEVKSNEKENGNDGDGDDEKRSDLTEVQYLIKWKGWSYIHNTWESESTLREQKAKGMKKLDNFIKKELEENYWRRYAGPEDIDYYECKKELQNDLIKSYNNVDRIIARNDKKTEGISEYLCKWESLPYSEATWEDGSLVMRKWKRCIDQYEERELSKCTPSRHCKVLKYRPKFYKIKTHQEFLNGDGNLQLRDYQMDGLNWLLHSWCKENSVILADEMGLGKTIQTICFLYALHKVHHLYGPFLCVVPLSTMTAWQREFDLWAPDMNVVTYLGDVKSREMIRQYEWTFNGSKRLKFNCILTTYEIVLKDKIFLGALQWAVLLVDEAHRLKNDDSLLYKSLKEFVTNHRLLITGTPLQNSLKELWALLHFIMPEKFVTWEDFEMEHGNAADKGYTTLHQQLEPYILRRVKKDVEKSLPAKVEQILRVEMTALQKQYYKWILTKNFDALRKGRKGSTSTFLNIVIELKKCCNHAILIRPSEFELIGLQQDEALQTLLRGSGKLVLLDKLLCRLKETGHRVLIFSQMVRMLDILAEYLQKRHFPFQRLDGSIKGEMRRQALDHFNAEGSADFCFLLSTRAGGLGINLATADTVIIFDSDWNPQNDLQAQARAHRIGQKNQVNIYRLVTARSVEEQIVERAKQKMVLDHLVIQRMDTTGRTVLDRGNSSASNSNPFNKDDLSAILKFGAEELFKDEQENDEELVCDIDEILRRAETRNEDPETPADDLLSAFKVASIAAFEEDAETSTTNREMNDNAMTAVDEDDTKDWDDIIPEDYRKIVEDEERAKEMEDLYLPPRRKTTSQMNANRKNGNPRKAGGAGGGGGMRQEDSNDSDYEIGSDASGEGGDGKPRKRGRPALKEKINGFTDAEIRRFIKSYKKFPAPLMRLEAIACDAELQEKPFAELKRIGEMLHDRCVQFLQDHKDDVTAATTNNSTNKMNNRNDDNNSTGTSTTTTAGGASSSISASKQKRTRATFSVKLGGVSFNAKTLLACEEELQPLTEIIPNNASERSKWILDIKTRPANFDVEWSIEDDSKLLCGIYQYGIGSWEQMKIDPSLHLTEKILINDGRKPQVKHLQSRAEYLLKIIKKNVELKKGLERKLRKPRKTRDMKASATAIGSSSNNSSIYQNHNHQSSNSNNGNSCNTNNINLNNNSNPSATMNLNNSNNSNSIAVNSNNHSHHHHHHHQTTQQQQHLMTPERKNRHISATDQDDGLQATGIEVAADRRLRKERRDNMIPMKSMDHSNDYNHNHHHHHHHETGDSAHSQTQSSIVNTPLKKSSSKTSSRASNKRTTSSYTSSMDATNKPMHFTANNEPRALDVLGDLDPNVFNECKEKMRPVKKSLKALDCPDVNLCGQDRVTHTRECILSIGRQIDQCLLQYRESERREWRNRLWYFVSKFTEFDAKNLFKMYKEVVANSEDSGSIMPPSSASMSGGGSNSNNNSMSTTTTPVKRAMGKDGTACSSPQITSNTNASKLMSNGVDEKSSRLLKKKRKDRDYRDKDRSVTSRDSQSQQRYGDSNCSEDFNLDATQLKRKRHESEMLGGGGGGGDQKSSSLYGKRQSLDSGGGATRNRNLPKHRNHHHHHHHHHGGGSGGADYYATGNGSAVLAGTPDGERFCGTALLQSPSSSMSSGRNLSHSTSLTSGSSIRPLQGRNSYSHLMANHGGDVSGGSGSGSDRWNHNRDRYLSNDYKRDRYSMGGGDRGGGYHNRDHRDRNRDRRGDRLDKRSRYQSQHLSAHGSGVGYPHGYLNSGYYMPNGGVLPAMGPGHCGSGYRTGGGGSGSGSDPRYSFGVAGVGMEWSREARLMDSYSPMDNIYSRRKGSSSATTSGGGVASGGGVGVVVGAGSGAGSSEGRSSSNADGYDRRACP